MILNGAFSSFYKALVAVVVSLSFVFPCFAALALDPTFDSDGKLTISFPDSSANYYSQAFRVFIQPSGRIVVGGIFSNQTPDGQLSGVAWAGLTTNGGLDPGFGFGGKSTDWRSDAFTSFSDAFMYPDGSTLRMSQILRLPVGSRSVSTQRLSPNGGVDGVYGSNVNIGLCGGFCGIQPVQITAKADGKILAFIVDGAYLLFRLNPDGTRDNTFGINGGVNLVFNKFTPASFVEMVPLSDGKTLLVGHVAGGSEFFFARLTESGAWDKTFGRAGFVRMRFGDGLTGSVSRAILQADGKILLAGSITSADSDIWIARFRRNGRPDDTFGNNGSIITDLDLAGNDVARSVALSSDGKIRVVGTLGSPANFLVARFSANGSFEESISFPFTANEYADATDLAIQNDGKIVVAGRTRDPNTAATTGSSFAVARLTE